MIVFVLFLLASGLAVGWLGRLLVPSAEPMTIPQMLAVGLAASAISGVAVRLIWGPHVAPGLIVNVPVAMALVYGLHRYRTRLGTPTV